MNDPPTRRETSPQTNKIQSLDDRGIARIRALASQLLRRRKAKLDPGTESLLDGVVVRLLRAEHAGVLPDFNDEIEITKYMSRAIRNHLVDLARERASERRPPERKRAEWPESANFPATREMPSAVLDVNDALTEFAAIDPKSATLVEMMFFGGATQAEAAAAVGGTVDSVRNDWEYAKAWLKRRLGKSPRN